MEPLLAGYRSMAMDGEARACTTLASVVGASTNLEASIET